VPGSSAFTFINMVTYGNAEKTRFIEVHPETLNRYGAVSPHVAMEMALGMQKTSRCDVALAITGIAGPEGGSEEKPVGLAYVGIAGFDGEQQKHASESAQGFVVKKIVINPRYSRGDVKYGFSHHALHFLLRYLRGELETDYPDLCAESSQGSCR
jgi:PncC family amidohydrolase